MNNKSAQNILAKTLLIIIFLVELFSCANGRETFVRDSNTSLRDVESVLYDKTNKFNKTTDSSNQKTDEISIPAIRRSVISPLPPSIGGEKIMSFYVDETTPLKDVLLELARVAEVDIDIDPKISGNVIINAKNRPFKEILDRIASQAKLRYSYKNKVLYFEPNYPYMKNYFVDFLESSKLWDELSAGIDNIFNANAALNPEAKDSNIIVNKISGIVTVFATEPEHAAVQNFIEDLSRQGSSQVLIEARVFEVSLFDNFKYGIDWSKEGIDFSAGRAPNAISAVKGIAGVGIGTPVTTIKAFGSDIAGAVGVLQAYGVARSISSPRIHAINNTTATLKFNEKLVYFKVEQNQLAQVGGNGPAINNQTLTSSKLEENEGTEISITPSINLKTEEITMQIEPKITRKTGEVTDPASPPGFRNLVPIMNERSLSTIVKIKNGNTIVIGGLMKNSSENIEGGMPILSKIPLIGWLFKSSSKSDDIVETVVFIKATLINSDSIPNKKDRELEKIDPSAKRLF